MKAKSLSRTEYVCRDCGSSTPKWQGQCPACGAWNTLEESRVDSGGGRGGLRPSTAAKRQPLSAVAEASVERWGSGSEEFDRVLGGGFIPGGVVLIGGDPGIGKSTLMLQTLNHVAAERRALYVSGEESAAQIASRALRLGVSLERIELLTETRLEAVLDDLERAPVDLLVIDSIQTLYSEALNSSPGSVVQVRECSSSLVRVAKQSAMAVLLVGHVTKEGAIAGPRVLEHLVDTVVYFEGEPGSSIRILRAFKNRFGASNEIGVFAMDEQGLRPVSNPSALFMARTGSTGPGVALLAMIEGSRPLLVQVQALVDRASGNPRRVCTGFDGQRLAMLLAVMNRHLGLELGGYDVFVNVVGGIKISEPAADLAIILAVWSSLTGHVLPSNLAVFGEVGLAGEVRPVVGGALRIAEADKLGVQRVLGSPSGNKIHHRLNSASYVAVRSVAEALACLR